MIKYLSPITSIVHCMNRISSKWCISSCIVMIFVELPLASSANNNDNNVILMSSIQGISFYQQRMLLDTVFIVHILI